MSNDYISHHGIKGMRWGVRRYQNEDGSLTAAGKKRRNIKNNSTVGIGIGARRYKDKNGNLNSVGSRRLERDKQENQHKKPKNQVNTSSPDYDRWVKEDRTRTKAVVDQSKQLTNSMTQATDAYVNLQKHRAARNQTRLDLSNYSDQELRQAVNRELLERQYNSVFNAPKTRTEGAETVKDVLQIVGSNLAIVSSTLGIALAVKELRG